MANEREVSSATWMGALALLIAAAGSALLVASEGKGVSGPSTRHAAVNSSVDSLPFLQRGAALFARNCAACHGDAGRGGVPNQNYIKDTVPELNTLAEKKMLLPDQEETAGVVKALEQGTPVEQWEVKPATRAQFENVRNIIRKGNPAGKKDPKGPVPPFQMSPWNGVLSERDIDSILAYLLTLQSWKE